MRSIKDDFKPISGSHVFYTPVLRGPEWKRQGLPRIGPVDRMVWHYLRAIDSVKRPTVAEIARQVWHPDGDYRSSARSSLKRLKAAGLAESDSKKRWFSKFPDSQGGLINPESGQINPYLKKSQGGSINPESGLIDPESGSINPPEEIEQSGLINPPKVGQSTHLSGQINPPKWADQPTIEKREERRKEKLASMRENPTTSDFEEKASDEDFDFEKFVGEEKPFDLTGVIESKPGIFKPDLKVPESLDGRDIYFDVAVEAEMIYRRSKGTEILKPLTYGARIYEDFEQNPEKAQQSLKAGLKVLKAQREERARRAGSAKAAEKAKRLTQAPDWGDSPELSVRPWLEKRFKDLSRTFQAIESSEEPDLKYPKKQVAALFERFEGMWERAGRKSPHQAIGVRRQFIQAATLLAKNLKSEGVQA